MEKTQQQQKKDRMSKVRGFEDGGIRLLKKGQKGLVHVIFSRFGLVLVLLVLPRALWLCRSLKDFASGHQEVPEKPAPWMGPMMKWGPVREAGVDWFLMRWLTARNTLSGFCLMICAAKLILLII